MKSAMIGFLATMATLLSKEVKSQSVGIGFGGVPQKMANFGWQANEIGSKSSDLNKWTTKRAVVTANGDTLFFKPLSENEDRRHMSNGELVLSFDAKDKLASVEAFYENGTPEGVLYTLGKPVRSPNNTHLIRCAVEKYEAKKHGIITTWILQ